MPAFTVSTGSAPSALDIPTTTAHEPVRDDVSLIPNITSDVFPYSAASGPDPRSHLDPASLPVIKSSNTQRHAPGTVYRSFKYCTTPAFVSDCSVVEPVCLDTGCTMTTTGPDWIERHCPDVSIQECDPVKLTGVGGSDAFSSRFASIPINFFATAADRTKAIAQLQIEVHILEGYAGPLLIGMDVMVPEGITVNPARRRAYIQSCDNCSIDVEVTSPKAIPHTAVLRAAHSVVIPPRTTALVDISPPRLDDDIDYILEPDTARHSYFSYHAAILDSRTTVIPVHNNTKLPKRIGKNMRLVYANPCQPEVITATNQFVHAYHLSPTSDTQPKPETQAYTAQTDDTPPKPPEADARSEGKSPEGITIFGSSAERDAFARLLAEYDVWTDSGDTIDIPQDRWMRIPLIDNWQEKINTRPRQYPASPRDLEVINEIFDRLHRQGRMKWSVHPTPFTFPVFVVWRTVMKDGKPIQKGRAVIDIRGLNAATKKDSYPLPSMDEMHNQLQGKHYISVFDGSGWFHQWRIHPTDTHKVTVISPRGQEMMLVTPMGFKNSVAHVQRQADHELREHAAYARTYVDDTVVFSDTFDLHCQHLRSVLATFVRLKASLNPAKSFVGFPSVTLLGKKVDGFGLSTQDQKVNAILALSFPKSLKELETYIGLTQWFRHFIPYYAYIVHPLHLRKLRLLDGAPPAGKPRKIFAAKAKIQEPTAEEIEAFTHLQECFRKPAFLAHHQPARTLFIETDASKQRGFGGFLYHADVPPTWSIEKPPPRTSVKPILFLSKMLTAAESKLWPTEMETAAVIWVLKQAYRIVQGNKGKVVLYTDHSAIAQLATQTTMHSAATDRTNIKLARAAEYIQRFDLLIFHRPGRQHVVADALSRLPSRSTPEKPNHDLIFNLHNRHVPDQYAFTTTLVEMSDSLRAQFIEGYKTDRHWGPIYLQMQQEHLKPAEQRASLPYLLVDDLLYTVGFKTNEQRLVVPKPLIQTVIHQAHDAASHPGVVRTLERLQSLCIHRIRHHVEEYVRHCQQCLTNKSANHKPYGSLQPVNSPPVPFHTITIDFVTAFPPSTPNAFDAVLTITDKYTKRIALVPGASNWNGNEWGLSLVERLLVADWGIPAVIISDRDSLFLSAIWHEIFKGFDTQLLTSTAYHPQTDGQSERTNMTIEIALRHLLPALDDAALWPTLLPLVQASLNSSKSLTTGHSPHELMYGMPTLNPIAALTRRLCRQPDFARRLEALDLANYARTRSKYYYDRQHEDISLPVGSSAFIRLHKGYNIKSALPRKLQPRRIGPFRILERVGRLAYRLDLPANSRIHPVLSIAQLEPAPATIDPFHRDNPPPGPVTVEGEPDHFEIEKLLDTRRSRGHKQYLVKWKGWGDEWNEWYNEEDLSHAPDLIREFSERHAEKTSLKSRLRSRR